MVRAAGLELGSRQGNWRFMFIVLDEGILHRVDRFAADAIWQEALAISLEDIDALRIGPRPAETDLGGMWLFDEAGRVAASVGTPFSVTDPEMAYAQLAASLAASGGTSVQSLPQRNTLEGFQARLELLHAASLRPFRIYGGIGLLEPNDLLDATVLAWSAHRAIGPHRG